VIEEWKTEAQNRFELFQSGVHAATE